MLDMWLYVIACWICLLLGIYEEIKDYRRRSVFLGITVTPTAITLRAGDIIEIIDAEGVHLYRVDKDAPKGTSTLNITQRV